jgi:Branched-chain amino acid transport protein (AzlD)
MNGDLGTFGVWIAIAAMAVVTYAIRAGGFWLMGYVPLTQRMRSILNALPGSVLQRSSCRLPCAAVPPRPLPSSPRSWSWLYVETTFWRSFAEWVLQY